MTRRTSLALALALVAATVVAYLPALSAGFVWNDDTYLTDNPTLDGTHGLRLIWTDTRANEQYYPAVFTSFWVEKRVWGLHPLGYHLVNVLLHAGSALLLWWFLRRFGLPGAWVAAAAFALHPVCVESAAWVTERKNALSMLLTLLAAHAFVAAMDARAADSQPPGKRRRAARLPWYRRSSVLYPASIAAFTLALFAKTTACLLPAVLLVLAWWRRGRVRGTDVRPLVPFFAIGAALALNTAWLERTMVQARGAEWSLGAAGRVVLAGRALAFYIGKLVWPSDLSFIYPRWTIDPRVAWQWAPALGALVALAAAWALRRRLGRGPLASMLLFGGVVFPAMGFFNVYAMRYSYVADHFAYQAVAVASAAVACGAAGSTARAGVTARRAAAVAGVAVLAALGVLTFRQCRAYRSEDALWRDALAKNPDCFICHTNYGHWLAVNGRVSDAVGHFEEALRLKPDNVLALLNLARIEEQRGDFDGAVARYRAALAIDPADADALVNLGTLYTKAHRPDDAIAQYEEALRHPSPDDYLAHNGMGVALMQQGRAAEAVEQFRESLRLRPGYGMAAANLERALAMSAAPR
ncbi:MAG TPA: tetratricopeptide repeat protein [Thermoanaerobaculaceae bacterium]|nr:tetratricopeptide repeat protein [Thermoanaerobaculaceae bacterium]